MSVENDILKQIHHILTRSANAGALSWDYAGYMFETRDGVSSGGTKFVYHKTERLPLKLERTDRRALTDGFKYLREITPNQDQKYWIKCLAVLQSDGEMRTLFEFTDTTRWSISPANFEKAYEILLGEAFPKIIKN